MNHKKNFVFSLLITRIDEFCLKFICCSFDAQLKVTPNSVVRKTQNNVM